MCTFDVDFWHYFFESGVIDSFFGGIILISIGARVGAHKKNICHLNQKEVELGQQKNNKKLKSKLKIQKN